MSSSNPSVFKLEVNDVPAVIDVLCDSFYNYPVMRFVLGRDRQNYDEDLKILIHFFVIARVLRREILLGIGERNNLHGVALVSFPAQRESPQELMKLRESVWNRLGAEIKSRYDLLTEAWAAFQVNVPHIHLNMIGVRSSLKGKGFGKMLIESVQRISAEDNNSQGVSLTTEDSSNIAIYKHFGYEITGSADITAEISSWGFFRYDAPVL
jgi:ribosomal protein S18 acetylase RimI-like enzyme